MLKQFFNFIVEIVIYDHEQYLCSYTKGMIQCEAFTNLRSWEWPNVSRLLTLYRYMSMS